MGWRATVWLMIALVTAASAQNITIDNDITVVETIPAPEINNNPQTPQEGDAETEDEDNIEPEDPEPEIIDPGLPDSDQADSSDSTPEFEPEPSKEVSCASNEPTEECLSGETVASSSSSREAIEADIVTIDHGKVQGYYKHEGIQIRSFIDIPYGALTGPFTAPKEPSAWEDIHEVIEHSKRCPQLQEDGTYVGDLDCLTLSVYAYEDIENAPVLFHIHDGNFISGSGDDSIYGPEHLVNRGVILVLPNYRLGALGFMCLQNEIAPGNAALKDLTLALNWTKHNIQAFGGNPENIVVSGDGSSGALVGYLALSPKSKGYIARAITESGSVLSHWAIDRDPIGTATQLTKVVELNTIDATNEVYLERIAKAAKNIKFKPCLENSEEPEAFMDKSPWAILQDNTTEINIDFMIGAADHAGMHEALSHAADSLVQLNQNFSLFLPDDLKFDRVGDRTAVGERVKRHYFADGAVNAANRDKLSLCYTDVAYLGPAIRAARSLIKLGVKVHLYEFSFLGDFNREHNSLPNPVEGAARGDIVGYVFTQDGELPVEGTDEERIVNTVTDLWINFIKTGNPSTEDIIWDEMDDVTDSDEEWLSIGADVTSETGLHVARMRLWTEIYEKHFVEHNTAFGVQPCLYSVIVTFAVLFIMSKGCYQSFVN